MPEEFLEHPGPGDFEFPRGEFFEGGGLLAIPVFGRHQKEPPLPGEVVQALLLERAVFAFADCIHRRMNSVIGFLRELRHDAGLPIVVIMDGGSYHTSGMVTRFAMEEGQPAGIHLFRLPPYSPELNPDEQVWNHAKFRLGRLFIDTKSALREAVEIIMFGIQRSNDLVKPFLRLENTMYPNISL